jgi:proteasome lid subunit RPN8/RPN11
MAEPAEVPAGAPDTSAGGAPSGAASILTGAPPAGLDAESRGLLYEPGGCSPGDLRGPLARGLAETLARGLVPFARLEACRAFGDREAVVFEVDVERGQRVVHDVRHVERLAAVFDAGRPDETPELLALRDDFPGDVPHLNLRTWAYPRSLCLYDVAFRDVRPRWTPARYVALIREWLRKTARGDLHADDQPLEPLLPLGLGWVVLPAAVREAALRAGADETEILEAGLVFEPRREHQGRMVLVGVPAKAGAGSADGPRAMVTIVRVRPRTHGVIRRTPATLADLHAMLAEEGDDLLGALRRALGGLANAAARLEDRFVLVLVVPQRRRADGPVERTETLAFFLGRVGAVGRDVGAWELRDGVPGAIVIPGPEEDGRRVKPAMVATVYEATRDDLARLNGAAGADDRRVVAVGAGALGSQVMLNAARAGFGRWTTFDADLLLPHNLARHGLFGDIVGWPKAWGVEMAANSLTPGTPGGVHDGRPLDVLDPDGAAAFAESLKDADLVVDLSASVTVARALARDSAAVARRVSVYLSPTGADLTVLAEDAARATPLDALEMQLYRAMVHDDALGGLLEASTARVRYGRSCRDVSVQLPQALVGVHAGLATLALQQMVTTPAARAAVWRVDPETLAVRAIAVAVAPMREVQVGAWRLVTDAALLGRLHAERDAKLPNETGGVLLGTYDFGRQIVYVVDAIASPRDSRESPTSYYRGCEGLPADVERVEAATAGQLHYIGEWHSHPRGHSCLPSAADADLFRWIGDELASAGLPPLMCIVGDDGVVPYLERLPDRAEYPAVLPVDPLT